MNQHVPRAEHTVCHDWVRHWHSRRGDYRTGITHGLRRLYIVSESFDEGQIIGMEIYLGSRLRSLLVNGHPDIPILRFSGTVLCGFGAFIVTGTYSWNDTSVFCFFQDIFDIFTLGVNAPIMLASS